MKLRSSQPNLTDAGAQPALTWRAWALVPATGVLAGLGAGLLMWLLRAVQHGFWAYRTGNFLEAVSRAGAWRCVLVLLGAGALIGVVRRGLRLHGTGLSAAIWFDAGRVALWPSVVNAVLSIVGVGMGVALGREGAPKEIGAAAASALARRWRLTDGDRRLLAACGAGAGMGAVYDVPLGGALFALEVLLGTLALPLVVPALAASAVATAVAWLLLGHQVIYAYSLTGSPPLPLLVWSAVIGPAAGLVAVVHIRAIAWANGHRPGGWRQVAVPVLVLGVLGLAAVRFPQLLGNGRDVIELALQDRIGVPLLGLLLVMRLAATTGCLASGAPGGLFTPTMTLGALLGGLLGHAWNLVWPGAPPGSQALIGAAAFLTAATQGPVSSVVLVLELTRRIDPQIVPVLLASCLALLTTRALESRSIYSARVPSSNGSPT